MLTRHPHNLLHLQRTAGMAKPLRLMLAVGLCLALASLLPGVWVGGSDTALRMEMVPVEALVEAFEAAPLPPRNHAI